MSKILCVAVRRDRETVSKFLAMVSSPKALAISTAHRVTISPSDKGFFALASSNETAYDALRVALVKKTLLSAHFSFEISDDSSSGSSGVLVVFDFVRGVLVATQVDILHG